MQEVSIKYFKDHVKEFVGKRFMLSGYLGKFLVVHEDFDAGKGNCIMCGRDGKIRDVGSIGLRYMCDECYERFNRND